MGNCEQVHIGVEVRFPPLHECSDDRCVSRPMQVASMTDVASDRVDVWVPCTLRDFAERRLAYLIQAVSDVWDTSSHVAPIIPEDTRLEYDADG